MSDTMTLQQAAQACDAAFTTHATLMSAKTQSIMTNPCFGAGTQELLTAGFENGDTKALAELARRASRKGIKTVEFLMGKFKGMQRKADKAKEVAAPKAAPKAKVVEPVSIPAIQPDLMAALMAALAQAGLIPAPVAVAPVVAAPAATHPDVIRNTKVIVADAIHSQDREALKAGLVELGLVKADCRQRFAALAKVAEQLNVNVKKHKAPASVPNMSIDIGNLKFTG